MRKITLFLMLLFLTVGAMAQFEAGKLYRIKVKGTELYLSVGGTAANTHGEVYGAQGNKNDNRQIFMFEQLDNGAYYVKSNSGEYISYQGAGAGWNVNADPSREKAHELTFESVDTDEFNNDFKIKCFNQSKNGNKYFKWEYVGASGKYHPFNDDDNGAVFIVEEVVREGYVHNDKSINRTDRGLTSFTITDGENNLTISEIQTSSTSPVYIDKTSYKLTTKPGATLKFTEFNYTGSWMHAYAYVDYNKDYFFKIVNNNDGTNEGEIVSYNYYNGTTINGTTQNAGSAMAGVYNDSKAMPAFKLPENLKPGEYRIRIKVDWDNLDADYGDTSTNNTSNTDGIAHNGGCQCDFTLVVIPNPHTLTVTDAGWATLYLDFPAEIPTFTGEEAGAYIVTGLKEDNWLNLVNVKDVLPANTDVLPANTGILVKASKGNYTFNYAATATEKVDGNLLKGTVASELVEGAAYVLGYAEKTNELVFGKAKLTDGKFLNNANKAYLPATSVAGASLSASLRFDFGGTTAIEEVETENAETVIYDLTGRRVNEITKAGVYVVNGRKVLVK